VLLILKYVLTTRNYRYFVQKYVFEGFGSLFKKNALKELIKA